jgi:hypothetical protein
LESLPTSRDEAICIARHNWSGLGEYTFIREVVDPGCDAVDLSEISLSAYANGELGITGLITASAITATANDIALYLREVTGLSGDKMIRLSLDIYDDAPDFERNTAWLCLEDSSGKSVAEFGLELRNRLLLPMQPESSGKAIYICELPTFRSAFRFVSIACELFRCDKVKIRSFALNSQFSSWFS